MSRHSADNGIKTISLFSIRPCLSNEDGAILHWGLGTGLSQWPSGNKGLTKNTRHLTYAVMDVGNVGVYKHTKQVIADHPSIFI